ncbi:Crp/Fnr family transcriptional regulator [Muricauda oceani]|jgi:CRP/FNR family transcriptional regulator, anaerobic regulatory protein|uniref:Crp/Fnr family transcriptional regulator n=2 Tax=Flagellimonas TaxID=444459 RepID=A0A6G7IZ13_9FLAO|nr:MULTISPECIES: Crp/Fnr family transcriptional regulator [Allomuricauda]MBW8244918.1 Crp/Fnr family transcriptional regulator [Allomuricauda oceani]MDF0708821.1 Crp/Fnr family transcriptional regulator [[Muricauda] okinawensis]QII43578.1 Crp/Fnr family transcriptional regulator [Allomuricauda oceani]
MLPNKHKEGNLFIILFLNSIYPLSPSLKNYLVEHIKSCYFEKNQFICKAGEVCDRLYLIKKGMVRGYFESDGMELTTWVDTENEVFTSITGFFRNQPCQENIQSLEETHCDYMEYEDYKYCLNNFPEMRHINRILLEEYYILAEQRVYLARIPNAQKRLTYYMEKMKPQIVERIPRKHLASYLAIRPETLSRLLKEID